MFSKIRARLAAQRKASDERGFTLIELSIVLIIVGLLIGGVVGGQALIEKAQVTTASADLSMLRNNVISFRDDVRRMPGYSTGNFDAQAFWSDMASRGYLGEAVTTDTVVADANGTMTDPMPSIGNAYIAGEDTSGIWIGLAGLSPQEALKFEDRLDDGVADTGRVRAIDGTNDCDLTSTSGDPTCDLRLYVR